MELKNQIVLVILIPIVAIMSLAIFQVGLLGFVSIPGFQDSLLDFHITRHINGIQIEMNIVNQEVFIQNQAYLNLIFGIAAHLRHYAFGDFTNQTDWNFSSAKVAETNFFNTIMNNQSMNYRSIDWYHPKYSTLDQIQTDDEIIYQKLKYASQSLKLGDILINPDAMKELMNVSTIINDDESTKNQVVAIDYEFMHVICSDGLLIRFPAYTDVELNQIQQKIQNNFHLFEGIPYNSSMKPGNTMIYKKNFTVTYANHTIISNLSGLYIQVPINTDSRGTTCDFVIKIMNNYLQVLAASHTTQGDQESKHYLFIGLYDQNFSSLSKDMGPSTSLSQVMYQQFIGGDNQILTQYDIKNEIPRFNQQLQLMVNQLQSPPPKFNNYFGFSNSNVDICAIVSIVQTESDKIIDPVYDDETQTAYLHIQPLTNNYTIPTFILVHTFDKNQIIQELYRDTSLNNVKVLEIVVFIIIVVLSIVIFAFVWYTAKRIGLSFEQPIRVLTDFMNSIDIQNMDQEEELMWYEEYFNSFEIKALFKTMNIFVTTIKYSNQKYSNSSTSDAIALMELSRAKDFYKKEIGNMSAVGICANNIGILHMKGHRVFEAVNEMEEAIYIAKQELQEIKELKKWCKKMIASYKEPNFYSNFRYKLQTVAKRLKQIEFTQILRIQQKQQSSIKTTKTKQQVNSNTRHGSVQISKSHLIGNRSNPAQSIGQQSRGHGSQSQVSPKHADLMSNQERKDRYEKEGLLDPILDNQTPHVGSSIFRINKGFASANQSSIIQSQRNENKESILSEGKYISASDSAQHHLSGQQGDQSIYSNNQTEMDLLEEKIFELRKKKQLASAKLENRQFQLAQFMFNICMQYSDVFIPETLKLFKDFETGQEKKPKKTQSDKIRLIKVHVKKAICYIQLGEIEDFKKEKDEAEKIYDQLRIDEQQPENNLVEDQDYNFVDMFKNVPLEVLNSKILQLKAIYELIRGNFRTSAEILTQIIEMGEYYDPEVRDFCLVVLENIFRLFDLPTLPIKHFQSQISINVQEIVILIDYSKEMTIEQINLSHSIVTQIFGILQPQDLIGLYGFNDSLHEAFPLQPKGIYKDLLSKQLFMAITAPGGQSKLYKALMFSLTNFFENIVEKDNQQSNFDQQTNTYIKFQIKSENQESVGYREKSMDECIQKEKDDGDSELDDIVDSNYFKSNNQYNGTPTDTQANDTQMDLRNRYRYICLFTEINHHPTPKQQDKLQKILLQNQVDLLIFNIANQNANMLDLKQLSKITPRSQFVNGNANLEQIFGKSRQTQLQKKMYLEFF